MRFAAMLAGLALLLPAPAGAQGLALDAAARGIEQRHLAQAMRGALEIIHEAQCSPERRCARARPEEFENLPLTPGHARLALRTGMASGYAQSCGVDWEPRIFRPYMAAVRGEMKLNQRQTATMTLMHGYWQGIFSSGAKPEDCAAGGYRRIAVEQYLANPPPLVPFR